MRIACRGIRHRYPGADGWTLDGIDCTVDSGEAVAVVGPSGSGKTTLLSIMGLLLACQHGTVAYDGRQVNPGSTIGRETGVAWIFQTNGMLGARTVLDNAALGAFCRGRPARTRTAAALAALERVGIANLAERRAQELSGGELQRLAVARSLTRAPAVLFADEPTSNLDRANSVLVVDALLAHLDQGTSVVVATHDDAVAARCHRVVRLVDGRLESQPVPQEAGAP